ncbi:MAG TPA: hypothetical protein PKD45_09245 [Flavobacteriales bacterium]|nr:hypothetical protein [Flavobacteriales bacterium]
MPSSPPPDPDDDRHADLRTAVWPWFRKHGFREAAFHKGRCTVHTVREDQVFVFKLKERSGYHTFYHVTGHDALIVFEVRVDGARILWEGYCPLLLFAIWPIRLSFKPRASLLKYRAEGYRMAQAFGEMVQQLHRG